MKSLQKNNDPSTTHIIRPSFINTLRDAYNNRRKNIILLTGDTTGLFWNRYEENYVPLESTLCCELGDKFNIVRMDIATGINFYEKDIEEKVIATVEAVESAHLYGRRFRGFSNMIDENRNNALSSLILLKAIVDAFITMGRVKPELKPTCLILQYAGSLFPQGDFNMLSELDRQRLVFFLGWITDPSFVNSPALILLVNEVKSEVNQKITCLPNATHIEIPLPDLNTRTHYISFFTKSHTQLSFERGKENFCEETAGLTIGNIKDILEGAVRTDLVVNQDEVVEEVNIILQAQLGDIIRVKHPHHTPADIIGYKETGEIFQTIFERCEDPETAVSAFLISGPNGAGKTYQLEAHACQSGRIVVELAGIRGSYYGETDKFFELLRWHIATFGKILILVDEAHTAFGSVHSGDTHKTEKRLSGNIIKMMGDPRFLGKVLWGLMTSRPDELDPDVKSRSPIQVPIFDLEGDDRKLFVSEMFERKSVILTEQALDEVLTLTDYYSARDYRNLVAEVLAQRRKKPDVTVIEVLSGWQASRSIQAQREFQSLIAAKHCSYPNLLPEHIKTLSEAEVSQQIEKLKYMLNY